MLWNGGNENIWGHEDWGWKEELGGATWGLGYYEDLFPRIVAELDPTRPYAAGSPFSPRQDPTVVHPNDPDHGTHHQWEVWNRIDYTHYRDDVPRFSSEFGFQGPPTWATLERAVRNADGAPLAKQDEVWLLHQKAEDGNGKLDRGIAPHLGVPDDFTDWHWATQLNQARAVAHAITHYRSWWPRTAGSIVWQLNDCWPVTSWAAIDGDERPKPLWWALRAAYADRLLTVQTRAGWRGARGRQRHGLAVDGHRGGAAGAARRDGARGRLPAGVDVAPRSVELLALPDEVRVPDDAAGEVLVAVLDDVADGAQLGRGRGPAAGRRTLHRVRGGGGRRLRRDGRRRLARQGPHAARRPPRPRGGRRRRADHHPGRRDRPACTSAPGRPAWRVSSSLRPSCARPTTWSRRGCPWADGRTPRGPVPRGGPALSFS